MKSYVAISKEQQTEILNDLEAFSTAMGGPIDEYLEALKDRIHALRAAPETVSLEGVERFHPHTSNERGFEGMYTQNDGDYVLFSDMECLVAPVQPSAVVSREAFRKVARDRYEKGMQSIDDTFPESCADAIFESLQLPQPVAPVQGGGVDLTLLVEQAFIDSNAPHDYPLILTIARRLAHLTTTQSAPVADIAPSEGVDILAEVVLADKMIRFESDEPEWVRMSRAMEALQKVIQALRAAPETVSLDGVERYSEVDPDEWNDYEWQVRKDPEGSWVLFSDLQRLVAPVQSGGVDFMALPGIITAYYPFDFTLRANGITSNDEKMAIAQMATRAISKHLTTTQSAPEVKP